MDRSQEHAPFIFMCFHERIIVPSLSLSYTIHTHSLSHPPHLPIIFCHPFLCPYNHPRFHPLSLTSQTSFNHLDCSIISSRRKERLIISVFSEATLMAAVIRSLILMWIFIIFIGRESSSVTAAETVISSISAAPAFPPDSPLASPPALSPDITPLFPTPGGPALSPADSSLPTIPSSPSPPNPDAVAAPGPAGAFSPLGSLPASSAVSRIQLLGSAVHILLLPGILGWWLMQP